MSVSSHQGICIESQYSDLLNRLVSTMINRDFTLQKIDAYVSQIENFLNTVSSPDIQDLDIKSYLSTTTTSVQAIHFFFKEVLASKKQDQGPTDLDLSGLYRQLAL